MKVQFNTEQIITRRYEFDTETDLFNLKTINYEEVSRQCNAAIQKDNRIDERASAEYIITPSICKPKP